MSNEKEKLNNQQMDQRLESPESQKVARAVGNLPNDEPSLAWRSQLNAKLTAASAKQKKKVVRFRIWSYSTGVSLSAIACAVLFFAILPGKLTSSKPASEETIEGQMLAAHNSAARSADIAGEGFSSLDDAETVLERDADEWKKEDLEAL